MGYASAVQNGMRFAIEHGAELILQMDADFSHHPRYLPQILAKSATCDLVVGSRYIRGGGTKHWGLERKLLSGGANMLARTLLGLRTRDCTGGFRCWKRELIERAGILDVQVEGYAFLFFTLDRCRNVQRAHRRSADYFRRSHGGRKQNEPPHYSRSRQSSGRLMVTTFGIETRKMNCRIKLVLLFMYNGSNARRLL